MSAVSTHVLDLVRGRPAAGIAVTLEQSAGTSWQQIGAGVTDSDGRIFNLLPVGAALQSGDYRLTFDTETFFRTHRSNNFYPSVAIAFRVTDAAASYHVPLLLSPFGYSTYRGS